VWLISIPLPAVNQGLDSEVLMKLCGILIEDHVPWRELAEKLGMLTLTHLFQESASPCKKLLENYQVRDCHCSLGLPTAFILINRRWLCLEPHASVPMTFLACNAHFLWGLLYLQKCVRYGLALCHVNALHLTWASI